jgi:secreted trypsin-like serine protease
MVAGVTSYGNGCGESIHAGVYTRISMYMDWIKSIVGKDCVVTTGENSANVGTMSRRTVTHAPVRTISRYIYYKHCRTHLRLFQSKITM